MKPKLTQTHTHIHDAECLCERRNGEKIRGNEKKIMPKHCKQSKTMDEKQRNKIYSSTRCIREKNGRTAQRKKTF